MHDIAEYIDQRHFIALKLFWRFPLLQLANGDYGLDTNRGLFVLNALENRLPKRCI